MNFDMEAIMARDDEKQQPQQSEQQRKNPQPERKDGDHKQTKDTGKTEIPDRDPKRNNEQPRAQQ